MPQFKSVDQPREEILPNNGYGGIFRKLRSRGILTFYWQSTFLKKLYEIELIRKVAKLFVKPLKLLYIRTL